MVEHADEKTGFDFSAVSSLEKGQVFEAQLDLKGAKAQSIVAGARYRILAVTQDADPKKVDVTFQPVDGGAIKETAAWSFLDRMGRRVDDTSGASPDASGVAASEPSVVQGVSETTDFDFSAVAGLEKDQVFEARLDLKGAEAQSIVAGAKYRILSVTQNADPKKVDVRFQSVDGGAIKETAAWSFLDRMGRRVNG